METLQKQKRLTYVDAARGFAMLAIVYGHASRDVGLLAQAAYSFHVPLCVFLTGWLYEFRDISLKDHLKKTAYRLLLPYGVFSILSMGIYLLMGKLAAGALGAEVYSLKENLLFMARGLSIGNAPLWYLPFLFTSLLLLYFWGRLLRKWKVESGVQKALVILIPPALSVLLLGLYGRCQFTHPVNLPFGINNACFLFFFLWLGYVLKKTVRLPKGKKWLIPGFLLVGLSIFCALRFNDEVEYMSFTHSEYGRNIYVFYVTALISCLGILWIFENLGSCRLLSWFGRHSMAILVMHKFPVLFFQILLGDLPQRLGRGQWLFYLGISLISMVLCSAAGRILLMIAPWTLGEKKKPL